MTSGSPALLPVVSKDREEDAMDVLVLIQKLPRTHPYLVDEFTTIRHQLQVEKAEVAGASTLTLFREIATRPTLRRVFAVDVFL